MRDVHRPRRYVSMRRARPWVILGSWVQDSATVVSNVMILALRARMMGLGSFNGVSMKRLGWRERERECRIVERMARCRVRRMRVLRDW